MSIDSVLNTYQNYAQNGLGQMRNDFGQLGQSLQKGDIGAAQQDYFTIQQLFGQNQGSSTGGLNSNGSETASNGETSPVNSILSQVLNLSALPGSSSIGGIASQSIQKVISQYLSNSNGGGSGVGSLLSDAADGVLSAISLSI